MAQVIASLAGASSPPTSLFARVARRYLVWRATSEAEAALHGLDDRLLADVGIAREEIARRVRGG